MQLWVLNLLCVSDLCPLLACLPATGLACKGGPDKGGAGGEPGDWWWGWRSCYALRGIEAVWMRSFSSNSLILSSNSAGSGMAYRLEKATRRYEGRTGEAREREKREKQIQYPLMNIHTSSSNRKRGTIGETPTRMAGIVDTSFDESCPFCSIFRGLRRRHSLLFLPSFPSSSPFQCRAPAVLGLAPILPMTG